ncbi:MAG TPA: M14 family metallopeptidase [Gemmatimonadaceae bacterium]|nr:M14 family metallopeptidase [Gemmatimonadaceae bacterium]
MNPARTAYLRGSIAAMLTVASACATTSGVSPSSDARSPHLPRTRAERTGYLETSHYADVIAFLDSLRGRPELSFGTIGRTGEGRELPYVIASRPKVSTPSEARRLGRPIVYVQGNIHAGEVEGKEALLAVLRDLTASRARNALDSVVLIAVPIYNADGNERFGAQETNRGSQNGPQLVGVRANAQSLDLNRDYVKVEAPETRASLEMFNKWDPDVFVDLHTTDGSYHGYALTYAPTLNPAAPLAEYSRDSILPVLRQRMQSRHGFPTFDYGDFISDDTLSKGWVTFDSRPRFGTNYYGLRGKIAILSEAYSHDPFERRVKSTYAFVQEILSLAGERGKQWISPPPLPAASTVTAMPLTSAPSTVPIRSVMIPAPDSLPVVAEVMERTGDSTRTQAGVPKGRRRSGRFVTVRMPVYERFKPTLVVHSPAGYILPASDTAAVRVLGQHGLKVEKVDKPYTTSVQVFQIDSAVASSRPFQGHKEMRLVGKWRTEQAAVPRGSYLVRIDQPLARLAVYLLEPESDDGLVTWNFFDPELRAGGTYPVLKLLLPLGMVQ